MRRIMWLAGLLTLVAAGVYTAISLNRWEWSRALFFGLVLLVAEVGLATGLIMRKLAELQASVSIDGESSRPDPRVLDALAASRSRPNRFEWLRESMTRPNVFITMLVGGGVVVSALAWLLDKLGAATITPARERSLAHELSSISYPRDGLLVDEIEALAQAVPYYDDPKLRSLLRR